MCERWGREGAESERETHTHTPRTSRKHSSEDDKGSVCVFSERFLAPSNGGIIGHDQPQQGKKEGKKEEKGGTRGERAVVLFAPRSTSQSSMRYAQSVAFGLAHERPVLWVK